MSKQTNARGQITLYTYTNWGQPLKTTTPEQVIDYTYRTSDQLLTKVTAGTHFEVNYTYDALGRINKETEKEGTITLVKDFTFDAGRVTKVMYNNVAGDTLTYLYNTHGHLSSMKFGATTVYTVSSRNNFGQLTGYSYGNGVNTTRTYSVNGSPLTITAARSGVNLMNASYTFDDTKGLLSNRNDLAGGSGQENFTYDNLRRLTAYGNPLKVNNSVTYSNLANITFKTDAGTLQYGNTAKPYQVTAQINYPAAMDTAKRTITYNSGNRPLTLTKSGNTATFVYNHTGERTLMTVTGTAPHTRTYLGGNYEREVRSGTTTERLYLGGSA
jgi:YD repeat-containing protein